MDSEPRSRLHVTRMYQTFCVTRPGVRNRPGMTDPARSHPANGTRAVWRTRDVAAFWQRTPTTVLRWVDAGAQPPPRLDPGRQPYWLATEVEAFARRRHANDGVPAEGADTSSGSAGSKPDREDPAPLALVIGDGVGRDAAPVPRRRPAAGHRGDGRGHQGHVRQGHAAPAEQPGRAWRVRPAPAGVDRPRHRQAPVRRCDQTGRRLAAVLRDRRDAPAP